MKISSLFVATRFFEKDSRLWFLKKKLTSNRFRRKQNAHAPTNEQMPNIVSTAKPSTLSSATKN